MRLGDKHLIFDTVMWNLLRNLGSFFSTPPGTPHALASWLTALLPICVVAGVAVSEAALMLIVLLFVIHTVRHRDAAWLRAPWVKLALLLWGYIMLTAPFAEHPLYALRHGLGWLRYVIFGAALAFWTLRDEPTRRALFGTLLLAVLFLTADTLFQYISGFDVFGREWYGARLTGPYSMPRAGIMLGWMSFPVVAWALIGREGGLRPAKELLAGAALVAAILVTVILTGDRMPLLSMMLGLALMLLLLPASLRVRLAIGLGFLGLAAAVIASNPLIMARQFHSTVHVVTHLFETPYGMIWQSAWNIFEANPVVGVGMHHFRHACPDEAYGPLADLALRCNLHPHNIYMEFLSETGLIGFLLFLALVTTWLAMLVKGLRNDRTDAVLLGLSVEFFIRVWPLAATTSVLSNWSAVPFWMVLGWAVAILERRKTASRTAACLPASPAL